MWVRPGELGETPDLWEEVGGSLPSCVEAEAEVWWESFLLAVLEVQESFLLAVLEVQKSFLLAVLEVQESFLLAVLDAQESSLMAVVEDPESFPMVVVVTESLWTAEADLGGKSSSEAGL